MKNAKLGTKNDIRLIRLILMLGLALVQPLVAASLTPQPPVELTGTHGKFDFIKVDEARGRLLACHTGNGSLDVIDEATSKVLRSIPTGAAQGVAIDDKGGRYFVSVSKPPQLVIVDANKLEATGTVTLPGPADVCTYSAKLNRVVVDNDDKPEQWWINPDEKKIMTDITFKDLAGMEDLTFANDGTHLLQNIKDSDLLTCTVMGSFNEEGHIPTAPAGKPHGLALMVDGNVLVAGGNGKLVLIEYETGRVLTSADIAPHVDEIAYDPSSQTVYCASGTGVISVVSYGNTGFVPAASLPSAPGAHSIAVDPNTHTVWIVFAKNEKAYVQSFIAGKN